MPIAINSFLRWTACKQWGILKPQPVLHSDHRFKVAINLLLLPKLCWNAFLQIILNNKHILLSGYHNLLIFSLQLQDIFHRWAWSVFNPLMDKKIYQFIWCNRYHTKHVDNPICRYLHVFCQKFDFGPVIWHQPFLVRSVKCSIHSSSCIDLTTLNPRQCFGIYKIS